MKLLILASTILLFCTCSCQNKNEVNKNKKMGNKEIRTLLEKQIKAGYAAEKSETDYPNYNLTETDLNISYQILKECLIINGYKTPDNVLFNKKINEIFKRTLDYSSTKKNVYLNFTSPCNRDIKFIKNNTEELHDYSYYINKENNFITELHSIPEILDYRKVFPDIEIIENNIPISKDGVKIYKWNSLEDLSQQREKNIQILINRNKYLFNDSKASLVWLKFNDAFFLQSLVKVFGYVGDEQLNKFVLDNNLKENEEFGRVIWSKDCSGKLYFHEEIMKIIKQASKDEQTKYLEIVKTYLAYLVERDANGKEVEIGLTFSQKIEMMGKLAYHATKIARPESDEYFNFFPFLQDETDQKELEKSNYYNIKDFKEIYQETKNGGVWVPGMPE
ncbi:hypothetical protein [Flavobacterium sp.]|uniref:hypothetical protein n=1 Tax=Flavobacterium sp. TaxID=239 RepID=UPI00286DC7ED|nr:hypothetical protein [Flavobacterium sp.]